MKNQINIPAFNKRFPKATNIDLGTDGKFWGIIFDLPNKKKKQFVPLTDLSTTDAFTHLKYRSNLDFEEEMTLFCLN